MAEDWFASLSKDISGEVEGEQATVLSQVNVWESVKQHLQVTEYCPEANPNVVVHLLSDRHGTYFVLKNTVEKTYLRLSPSEHNLWTQMNGQVSVRELIVEHFMQTGDFAHNKVLWLVDQLQQNHMLVTPPISVWSDVSESVQQRSWLARLSTPAQIFLTRQLNIKGLDSIIGGLYRYGGCLCFTRVAQAVFLVISVLGAIAYWRFLNDPDYTFGGGNFIASLLVLWLLSIFPVVIHELGHALTVKHYGREVPRGGLMLYYGMPAAFVETTDIWLEGSKARLMVTWNGPFSGLIIGGITSLWIYLFPSPSLSPILFRLAFIAYLLFLFNVNPLFKLDGYYLLSDALDIPALRERSIAFVQRKLVHKLLRREKFTRDEWIFTVFGIISLLWSIYALYVIAIVWKTRLEGAIKEIIGPGYHLLQRFFGLLLTLAAISLVLLILLRLIQVGQMLVVRFARSGGLAHYGRLALFTGGLALVLGIGLPLAWPGYAEYFSVSLGLLSALLAVVVIPKFIRPYLGSPRGLTYACFVVALVVAGLAQVPRLFPDYDPLSEWLRGAALVMFAAGGILLIRRPMARLGFLPMILGLLGGIVAFFVLVTTTGLSTLDVRIYLVSILVGVIVWCLFGLQASARSPAVALLGLGGLTIGLSLVFTKPLVDLSLMGTLLMAAGILHLVFASLPELPAYDTSSVSSQTGEAVGAAVAVIVRRVIAQVYFESGWRGAELVGRDFTAAMRAQGVNIAITESQFHDQELPVRGANELTEIYGVVFDELHQLMCRELGDGMGTLAFGYGVDLLPWQNREVIIEVILCRLTWGASLSQTIHETKSSYREFLKRVPLFIFCMDDELDKVASRLRPEEYVVGEEIIREGDVGDRFYIVERGIVTVWQTGPDGVEREVAKLAPGQYFGEVALVTQAPRNATVRAATPVGLLSLSYADFDLLVRHYVELAGQIDSKVKYGWILRGMPIFDELENFELNLLAGRLQPQEYRRGEVVFRQGEVGDRFYIVESGRLVVTHEVDGKSIELSRRGPGEYVGEIALLQKCARTATVTAAEDTTLLSLEAEYFDELVSEYLGVGQTLERTGSRRLSFIQRVDSTASGST